MARFLHVKFGFQWTVWTCHILLPILCFKIEKRISRNELLRPSKLSSNSLVSTRKILLSGNPQILKLLTTAAVDEKKNQTHNPLLNLHNFCKLQQNLQEWEREGDRRNGLREAEGRGWRRLWMPATATKPDSKKAWRATLAHAMFAQTLLLLPVCPCKLGATLMPQRTQ